MAPDFSNFFGVSEFQLYVHEDLKYTQDSIVSKNAVTAFPRASIYELHQLHFRSQAAPRLSLVYDVHGSSDLELVLQVNNCF